MKPIRIALALAASLLLAACLFIPGKFTSTIDIRKDGSFSFAYKGEIRVIDPSQIERGASAPTVSKCYGPLPGRKSQEKADVLPTEPDMATADDGWKERECTPAERAEKDKERKASEARRAKEQAQMASLFGIAIGDDAAMRGFAEKLSKQAGWRTVSYRGNGVFDVDYAIAGRLDHDFVWPVYADGQGLYPFVVVRVRKDNAVLVQAPGYAAGGPWGTLARLGALGNGSGASEKDFDKLPRTEGSFTLTTDGVIATNNTEEGASEAAGSRTLRWTIGRFDAKPPEALIRR